MDPIGVVAGNDQQRGGAVWADALTLQEFGDGSLDDSSDLVLQLVGISGSRTRSCRRERVRRTSSRQSRRASGREAPPTANRPRTRTLELRPLKDSRSAGAAVTTIALSWLMTFGAGMDG